MDILSIYPGIENIGSSLDFPHLFVTVNHDSFSFLEQVGKPCLKTFGGKSRDYCENGKSLCLVRTFIFFFYSSLFNFCLHNPVSFLIFAVSNRLELEGQYCERVHATLAFAKDIEDFDDLVDPRHLFDYYLGPEPWRYVLEKIHREEKTKFVFVILRANFSL